MAALQRVAGSNERDFLQPLFEKWSEREQRTKPGRVRSAGAPGWLLNATAQNEAKWEQSYGCDFRPDVVWDQGEDGCRIIELKNGQKYEPLGMPEVLHHAHFLPLRRTEWAGVVKPTLIGNFNPMTRAALVRLLKPTGLNYLQQLEYLEFDLFKDETDYYIWFDDPFAPWQYVGQDPPGLPRTFTAERDHWYRIERTDSWIGLQDRKEGTRPHFMEVRYKMVAPIEGGVHGYLVWEGTPPTIGTGSGHDWQERLLRVAV